MSASTTIELAGHTTHRVGYGAMQLGDLDRLTLPEDEAVALLRAAAELGVDHIDTAAFYAAGEINRAIGRALGDRFGTLVLATKIGARRDPVTRLRPAQQPAQLREQVEENLRQLGAERLDLVYLRRADREPGIVATGDQLVPLDDQLAALIALREEGAIGAIGLSAVSAAQIEAADGAGVVAVQNAYNLIERGDEDVLAACRAHGIAWVPFFPLGSGFAGAHSVAARPEVVTAAGELGILPAQLALAWLLQHYDRTALIPGTRSLEHLEQNLAAARLTIPAEIVRVLDGLGVATQ
ncbi:MAG TPA: aldo/keto reductase [Gryllotalpicola sp.]